MDRKVDIRSLVFTRSPAGSLLAARIRALLCSMTQASNCLVDAIVAMFRIGLQVIGTFLIMIFTSINPPLST